VTTVEIEPAVIQAAQHFWFTNLDVMENPRHTLIVDDGRNFLLRAELENGQTYDVIIPEPCDPWQSFSTALYSKEFFELAARRLKAGGLFIQWVPIYELSVADFQSFWRTFNSVFPHVVAFANVRADEPLPVRLATSQLIFVGSQTELDVEGIKAGWERLPDWSRRYLATIHLFSAEDILHLFLFDEEGMRGYGEGAPLITDDRPILEFSTPINLAVGGMSEQVLADLESFLAGG
jgi:spermidine synthase